jgi:hypothetical protein
MIPHAQKVAVIVGVPRGIAGLHPLGPVDEIGGKCAGH